MVRIQMCGAELCVREKTYLASLEGQWTHLYQPLNCTSGVDLPIELLKRWEDCKFKGSHLVILVSKLEAIIGLDAVLSSMAGAHHHHHRHNPSQLANSVEEIHPSCSFK